jgi:pimeloyl-ACP methyl ester carboxylesterase
LDHFALAGESGGAAFTLTAAHQLADRVKVVALIASGGPIGSAERAGQKARNRVMSWLARNAPALNTIQVAMRRELANPARRERSLRRDIATAPESAHAALRIEYEAVADALRQGTRATVQELALLRRPWAYPLSEVKTPVHLWHGTLDRNAPIAQARHLARELPDATLHIGDSSGHDIGHDRGGEIMSVLASHMKPDL